MNEHLQELKAGGRPKRKWEIELEEKDKEIERLKTELQDTKEHLGEFLHEQEEENKRLNNIINELEKFTNARIQKCYDEGCYIEEFNVYNEYDSKIKELRGDKE